MADREVHSLKIEDRLEGESNEDFLMRLARKHILQFFTETKEKLENDDLALIETCMEFGFYEMMNPEDLDIYDIQVPSDELLEKMKTQSPEVTGLDTKGRPMTMRLTEVNRVPAFVLEKKTTKH